MLWTPLKLPGYTHRVAPFGRIAEESGYSRRLVTKPSRMANLAVLQMQPVGSALEAVPKTDVSVGRPRLKSRRMNLVGANVAASPLGGVQQVKRQDLTRNSILQASSVFTRPSNASAVQEWGRLIRFRRCRCNGLHPLSSPGLVFVPR